MSNRIKILVVSDRCFWAYHEIQKFIKVHLSDQFDIYTDFIMFYPPVPAKSLKNQLSRWRSYVLAWPHRRLARSNITYDIVVLLGFYYQFQSKISFQTKHLIKGIYTDGFPPNGVDASDKNISIEQFIAKYLGDADAIVCGSRLISDRYKQYFPQVYYANATNESLFKRLAPKTKNTTKRFVVGWTGNPSREFKGYHDYVVPAVQEAAKLRPDIELKSRFRGPLKTLPRFYDDVDVVLIASVGDAGPSLFQEASLCDVPAISNYSGVPSEIIENEINGLVVEREVSAMRDAIIRLYDDRELLYSFSNRIRTDFIKLRGVKQMTQAWRDLFKTVLRQRH